MHQRAEAISDTHTWTAFSNTEYAYGKATGDIKGQGRPLHYSLVATFLYAIIEAFRPLTFKLLIGFLLQDVVRTQTSHIREKREI